VFVIVELVRIEPEELKKKLGHSRLVLVAETPYLLQVVGELADRAVGLGDLVRKLVECR